MKLSIFTELFTSCFWWLLLWMFLAFLLGWLLRGLFGKNDDDSNTCCDDYDALKRRYEKLQNNAKSFVEEEKIQTVVQPTSFTQDSGVKAEAKRGVMATAFSKLKNDNLQIVEGIGPKMDEVLKKHGVGNWATLAGKSFDDLRSLLDKENPTRYRIIDPTTWPQQAKLAADGEFEELISLQKALDTGRTNTLGNTDSKLEKLMVKLGLLKKWKKNDLKAIEGIGPKIAQLFTDNGLATWKAVSEASYDQMKQILESAGSRFKLANPGSWAQQAKLADEDKWDELQALQDKLDAGK